MGGSQAAGRKAAKGRGNVFCTLPASELDNWGKAAAPLYDDFVVDMDKKGLPGVDVHRWRAGLPGR